MCTKACRSLAVVVDDFTRDCIALIAATSLSGAPGEVMTSMQRLPDEARR